MAASEVQLDSSMAYSELNTLAALTAHISQDFDDCRQNQKDTSIYGNLLQNPLNWRFQIRFVIHVEPICMDTFYLSLSQILLTPADG